jgi:hypothetical protein
MCKILGTPCQTETLAAEREQVRKFHTVSFRHLGILLLQNLYCEFFRLVSFLQLAIQLRTARPDDRVRSPTEAEDFSSSLCVQTGSGAHPAFCPMGTGSPFPGGKARPGVILTTHPHLVPRL